MSDHRFSKTVTDAQLTLAITAFETVIGGVDAGELPDGLIDGDRIALLAMHELRDRRRAHDTSEPRIVGWSVHSSEIGSGAMYNLDEKAAAFDAAKRWGVSITALMAHPSAPDWSAEEQ